MLLLFLIKYRENEKASHTRENWMLVDSITVSSVTAMTYYPLSNIFNEIFVKRKLSLGEIISIKKKTDKSSTVSTL